MAEKKADPTPQGSLKGEKSEVAAAAEPGCGYEAINRGIQEMAEQAQRARKKRRSGWEPAIWMG